MIIPIPGDIKVWLATGQTDMRKGMNSLALQVQEKLGRNPHEGDLFVFRGKHADKVKMIWHDGLGMSLYLKRLERGTFIWPLVEGDSVSITGAQLNYLLSGIDWRNPVYTFRPAVAG
jgi:transposase